MKLSKQNILSRRYFLVVIILSVFSIINGQYEIASYQSIKDEYPDDNIIKLWKRIELTIEIKEEKLDIDLFTRQRILYLKNSKGFDPEQSTYTSSFSELTDYTANTYFLDNGKYKKIPVKKYDKVKKFGGGVFFDDQAQLVFTYPGVAEGSVIELNTHHKINDPHFLGSFFLNEYIPVHDYELIIKFDKNVDIDFIKRNFGEIPAEISLTSKKSLKIYKLKVQKLKNIQYDEFQPDTRYFAPHIVPVIRSYKTRDSEKAILRTTDDLYEWYFSFIDGLNEGIDRTGIQEIVDKEVTTDMKELDKVKKLYHWVQENIKYIAFEDGMGGFIPRKADEVLKKRYGDCKDKSNLIQALLEQAGITSYFTWIGTRDIPYRYSEICSPQVDNHMIITYVNNGKYYFLDGTGSYQNIEIPTSFIQGKEALISIGPEKYEIQTVPIVPPVENAIIDSVILKLTDNDILGKGYLSASGLSKIDLQYLLDTDNKNDQKKAFENALRLGSNKFVLTDYQLPSDKRFAKTHNMSYNFVLEDYAQSVDDEIFLNMNLDRYMLNYKLKKSKQSPLELDNTLALKYVYVLKLPENYCIDHVPLNSSYDGRKFSYALSYELEDNELRYTHSIIVNTLLLEKEIFPEWNEFISSLDKIYKETVVIKRKNES